MSIRTRFAPSPTGFLHIGSARTALFNYLFAKHNKGEFLLRVEDTDKSRNSQEAKEKILDSLKWLGIDWDEEIIYQSEREARHVEIANKLLAEGKAYRCFVPQDEIARMREDSFTKGQHFIFESPWRDVDTSDKQGDFVIRIKAPKEGQTIVKDLLQGDVITDNSHIDDMVILRSDGTPTYMLAAPVDDHDMGITHIIRGDDHLNNAARQQVIYEALGWDMPKMVHIPLIHGPDGAKLSKRHGALGAHEYKQEGYLPQSLFNYLLRLGFSFGDKEFISKDEAIELFSIDRLGKSPSRLDFDKMRNMNAHYIKELSDLELLSIIKHDLSKQGIDLSLRSEDNLKKAAGEIAPRAALTVELADIARFYCEGSELAMSDEARQFLGDEINKDEIIADIVNVLENIQEDSKNTEEISSELKAAFKESASKFDMKLGAFMKYVRVLLTGQINSPSMFNMIAIIGKQEALRRIRDH